MPYLRPLYIKGILSMYKILSISWKESLNDLQNKFKNLSKNNNKNNELQEINNKMFMIFSFMNHFYQMINKGKLRKYEGLDYMYKKLNEFLTFSRQIISYKLLDINFEEFNQINTILKLIIQVKLFLIFCEYDTYQTEDEFIEDILLIFTPKENMYKENNINNNNINNDENGKENNSLIKENDDIKGNIINDSQNEEKMVIEELIKEIKLQNIKLDNIYLFIKKKYDFIFEKYKKFIKECRYNLFNILYENYFELNNHKEEENNNQRENSDDDEEESKNNDENKNEKKKKKRKNKRKRKNKTISETNDNNTLNEINNNLDEINNKIEDNNHNEINELNITNIKKNNNTNEIKEENKIDGRNIINNKNEENIKRENDKKESINRKISTIKTIQSIAKMTNKIINNSAFNENDNDSKSDNINTEDILTLPKNKVDFDEIKIKFFEPLVPYIEQYKKVFGNKKMPILSILQFAFLVFEEKYKREKQKLLDEIKNLKKAMNQMFIQIQLMGGGRDIFRSTLYYLILIFIPGEQNISSFFIKVQKLIHFFQTKVDADLLLLKNMVPGSGSNLENTNQIIKRLHQNSQYVLFIKSLFFMYKYFNYIVHLNTNEKLQIKNNEEDNFDINNNINNNSLITKMNSKNIKYNLPAIKNYNYFQEDYSLSLYNKNKDMIFPTFNFNDCFSSYANFLDELVTNEKTQIIIDQVIKKIEKENSQVDVPKFEINDLFQEKDGKRVFNLTGFDVQVIIHDIKKMKYKEETFENLVNSKTWEKSQQEN